MNIAKYWPTKKKIVYTLLLSLPMIIFLMYAFGPNFSQIAPDPSRFDLGITDDDGKNNGKISTFFGEIETAQFMTMLIVITFVTLFFYDLVCIHLSRRKKTRRK